MRFSRPSHFRLVAGSDANRKSGAAAKDSRMRCTGTGNGTEIVERETGVSTKNANIQNQPIQHKTAIVLVINSDKIGRSTSEATQRNAHDKFHGNRIHQKVIRKCFVINSIDNKLIIILCS